MLSHWLSGVQLSEQSRELSDGPTHLFTLLSTKDKKKVVVTMVTDKSLLCLTHVQLSHTDLSGDVFLPVGGTLFLA